jgi:signal transduction histidine kinase
VVDDAERAAIALGAAHLPEEQMAAIRALRDTCMVTRAQAIRSPLEQARHEEAITDWLDDHQIQVAAAELLADTPITLEMLDALEGTVDPGVLEPAIRWVACACALRTIVAETGEAASRISELVKAVRAYTHRDEGAPRLVDIQQSLTETLAVLRSKAKGKSARVRVDAQAGLPRVTAIGGELNQVWSNLLDNALDAIPQGGCVEVSARKEGTSVVVRVVDDGPGIPPENRERVFEPFFTTKPVGQGTGQGLDIVRRLVARQRGLVELISVPGRTEFRVTLPLAEPPAAASTGAAPAEPPAAAHTGAPAASPAADGSGNRRTETTVAGTTTEAASSSTDPEVRA